jgi:hypothetical protein
MWKKYLVCASWQAAITIVRLQEGFWGRSERKACIILVVVIILELGVLGKQHFSLALGRCC